MVVVGDELITAAPPWLRESFETPTRLMRHTDPIIGPAFHCLLELVTQSAY